MAEIAIFGFPHSSFVHIARLVLTHKEAPYTFEDLEPDMGSPKHLAAFGRRSGRCWPSPATPQPVSPAYR